MEQKLWPKVGICVWVMNDKNQALMMKRQGSTGAGQWAPPGGKLEFNEAFFDCAKRECKEEANIDVKDIKFIGLTNDAFDEGTHYVTIDVLATRWSGNPKIMEPDKCSQIGWYDLHGLPTPKFWTVKHLYESDFPCLCGSGKSFKNCRG